MPPTQEKCDICTKSVYAAERIEAGGRIFHKLCFKCSVCKMTLNLNNYAQSEGVLYCKNDFQKNVTGKNSQIAM
jgi:uncharacterized CHY-type Zn-finger protein